MAAQKTSSKDLKGGASLIRNAFLTLQSFQAQRLVLLTRTEQPFQTAVEIDQCIADLVRVLPLEGRRTLHIVLDMRQAPVRVLPFLDPAFERFRRETERGFAHGAVIVGTPLGKIRSQRLVTATDSPLKVVSSMEEALDF